MELGNNLDCYILIRNLLVAYSRQEVIMEERLTQVKGGACSYAKFCHWEKYREQKQ